MKHTLHTLRPYSQVNISRQLSWIHTTKQQQQSLYLFLLSVK